MSNLSATAILQDKNEPFLFHERLSHVDPIGARLRFDIDEEAEPVDQLSILLHERHHWLQHIGTAAGIFNYTFMELQGSTAIHIATEHPERLASLPIVAGHHGENLLVDDWKNMEYTRRLVMGGRMSDIKTLEDSGHRQVFTAMIDQWREIVDTLGSSPEYLRRWDALADGESPGDPALLAVDGWLLGARHLMESAARISEMIKAAYLPTRQNGFNMTKGQVESWFTGIYRPARTIFYATVNHSFPWSEFAFAFACDWALNCPLPPLLPSAGAFLHPAFLPGMHFLEVSRALGDFKLPEERTVTLDGIRQFLGDISRFTAQRLGDMPAMSGREAQDWLGHQSAPSAGAETDNDGTHRLRYLTSLTVRSYELRAAQPELLVLPVISNITSPQTFREAFWSLAPPITHYGPTNNLIAKRAARWALPAAVQNDAMRAVMVYDLGGVAATLRPYLALGLKPATIETHLRAVISNETFLRQLMSMLDTNT